ncbi:MAG: CrcB family protein [Phycisphaerales bacterium]
MLHATEAALVFVGGAVGSGLRFGTLRAGTKLGLYASSALGILNLTGCLCAGIAAETVARSGLFGLAPPLAQSVFIGGVLGGYTTVSAVSIECATAEEGPQRRRVLLEAGLTLILAAPTVRLGMGLASTVAALVAGSGT